MKKNKVTSSRVPENWFCGEGRVSGEDGKKQTIQTKAIIIATGSAVKPIPVSNGW